MSFVTAVRDYVDLINANFDSFHQTFGSEMTLAAFTKGTILYVLQSLKIAFLYLFTFQWLRDLAYLPVIIPKFTLNTYLETFTLPTQATRFHTSTELAFAGMPTLLQNMFLVGVFNSFFASLPLTFAHFISARQFYVKGWRAAAATNAGIIVGHLFFLAAVLFGWRPVLIPWLQFEPWNYLIALTITYLTSKSTFGRNAFQQMVKPIDFAKTAGIGFILVMCDQGVLFKYISTLTGGLETSYLEPATATASSLTLHHSLYIFGFFLGSVLFTAFFFLLASLLRSVIANVMNMSSIAFAAHFNTFSQIAFVAVFCVSVSFYGLDYLCTNPLGYVPYDRALVPGMFASYTLEDKQLNIRGIPTKQVIDDTQPDVAITKKQKAQQKQKSIFNKPAFPLAQDFDLSSYDRGVYLRRAMGSSHETKSVESYRIPTSEFWSSRTVRRKAPRGMFAKLLKVEFNRADRRFFKPVKDALGLRMGEDRDRQNLRQSEREARFRARHLVQMRRFWQFVNNGSKQKFDQFTVYDNVTAPFDPYVPQLTQTQSRILEEIDDLLNVPRADYAANLDRIDSLIDKYKKTLLDYQDPPFESRFSTVEDMTSDIFEGQTESQRTSKRKLALWPYLFSFLHEEDTNKALKQRILHERLRENPYAKILFRTDIDNFLARQPKEQMLTAKEEAELYFKRVMLKNLIQTTARFREFYKRDPAFAEAFKGSKSFANRVYNHQFNGTYKVVRQLMRIDLDPMIKEDTGRIMKYDMPLFADEKDRLTSSHEELFTELSRRQASPRRPKMDPRKFLSLRSNNRPFYAGWDDDRRAFVFTNRFLPKKVSSRAMRFNEKYPEFAPLSSFAMETKDKSSKSKNMKRIAFTVWPIPSKIAQDPLLSRTRPSAFMGDRPERYDVHSPSKAEMSTKEGRTKLSKSRSAQFLIRHFIPDFDFRPLQILFEEADKPNVDLKKARSNAASRMSELPPLEAPDFDFLTMDRWPSGFIVHRKKDNVWWLEEKPPVPFVDRGGYVWPGHEQLKINMQRYLPTWKASTFNVKNPFVKD